MPPAPPSRLASRLAPALVAALSLPLLGCIEDRLQVEIHTRIAADGTCTRRVEYLLERVDDADGSRRPLPAAEDALRLLHRFPSGSPWSVQHEVDDLRHRVLAEATLPSPAAIAGDYWRARSTRSVPARNHVSFAMDPESGVWEYAETLADPASPQAAALLLVRELGQREGEFAQRFARALAPRRLDAGAVKRAFRERLAAPLAREVEPVASQPAYGPRERQALTRLGDRVVEQAEELATALAGLAPVEADAQVREAADVALEAIGEDLQSRLREAGLSLPSLFPGDEPAVRFRATLTLPAPIVRANGCPQGDTITWEFEQEDLYGRGFEMWARAGAPSSP